MCDHQVQSLVKKYGTIISENARDTKEQAFFTEISIKNVKFDKKPSLDERLNILEKKFQTKLEKDDFMCIDDYSVKMLNEYSKSYIRSSSVNKEMKKKAPSNNFSLKNIFTFNKKKRANALVEEEQKFDVDPNFVSLGISSFVKDDDYIQSSKLPKKIN